MAIQRGGLGLGLVAAFVVTILLTLAATPAQGLETLLLVRHGEKELPWPDELETFQPLSEQGERRALNLGRYFQNQGIVKVYTSPTSRTVLTALPIARALDVPIEADGRSISRKEMGKFLKALQKEHKRDSAVLLVAHSNTIPMLLARLGAGSSCDKKLGIAGTEVQPLIEGYEGVWQIDFNIPGCAGMVRKTARLGSPSPATTTRSAEKPAAVGPTEPLKPYPITLDQNHLPNGQQRFRMRYSQEPIGQLDWRWSREGKFLVFHEVSAVDQAGIRRETTVKLDTSTNQLHSAIIGGPMGPSTADVQIQWDHNHIHGHSDFPRSRNRPKGKINIDRALPAGIFERTSVLSLLPAMPIDRKSNFPINWYEPTEDIARTIEVRVEPPRAVKVPAGTFQAYRVELHGGEPVQVVYISRETPRKVVKIELLGQPWAFELLP